MLVEGWYLKRYDEHWSTADGRIRFGHHFSTYGGDPQRWVLHGTAADRAALVSAGAGDQALIGLSMREIAQVCHEIIGCSNKLRLAITQYDIVHTPITIDRINNGSGTHTWAFQRDCLPMRKDAYYVRYHRQQWRQIARPLTNNPEPTVFVTRKAALQALTAACRAFDHYRDTCANGLVQLAPTQCRAQF